jgi:hypothetical protein
MQHAVHNRATIRVADRTDVSGRVTAGSINDRSRVKRQTTLWRIRRFRKGCALVAQTHGTFTEEPLRQQDGRLSFLGNPHAFFSCPCRWKANFLWVMEMLKNAGDLV